MTDPFNNFTSRYPDETIIPTAVSNLTNTVTYTATTAQWATMLACNAAPLPIYQPAAFTGAAGGGWSPSTVSFGANQTTLYGFTAATRVLAAGVRVRIAGLPTSTFMPAGTVYLLQLEADSSDAFTTYLDQTIVGGGETAAINAVREGKGFCFTMQELVNSDGIHLPLLPRGPSSFLMNKPNLAGYGAGSSLNMPQPMLFAVCYGGQIGTVIKLDYVVHHEFIPNSGAGGLLPVAVVTPDTQGRDSIHKSAAQLGNNIGGQTSFTPVKNALVQAAADAIVKYAPSAISSLVKLNYSMSRPPMMVANGLGGQLTLTGR